MFLRVLRELLSLYRHGGVFVVLLPLVPILHILIGICELCASTNEVPVVHDDGIWKSDENGLSLGSCVVIVGLESQVGKQLNGRFGRIVRHNKQSGRYFVVLRNGHMKQFKAESLKVLPPEEQEKGVAALSSENVQFLAQRGIHLDAIEPLGAAVSGMDLRKRPDEDVLAVLQYEMAERGFLVFKDQGVLTGTEQVNASEYWGGRRIHSTHGVHPESPNRHIFRLSNDRSVGILGVGPQWHNDGSFERGVFAHVGYHIVRVPENGGATLFAHQGVAYDALPKSIQNKWDHYVSVNSNSGVLHPLVHAHPITGRKSVWLHLGMTGAVFEVKPEAPESQRLRLLERNEMRDLFHTYNDLLNAGLPKEQEAKHRTAKGPGQPRSPGVAPYAIAYPYEPGDCIFIDNLAIAHRAAPEAHASSKMQGLRILHRTTVRAMINFDPAFGLPPYMNMEGKNPLGQGVWEGGGIGFRWDENIRMQN